MSELGYKQALNCEERKRQIQLRIQEAEQEIQAMMQQLRYLHEFVGRLGYDLQILAANSCCRDPDCPDCRNFPEKSTLKNCNVTVDLRRNCCPPDQEE